MADILEIIKKSDKRLFVGLAGPGTGKTHTFKTIIESEEFKGKKILILSFTRKLVNDLDEHFRGYSNIEVATLHAFARRQFVKQFKVDLDLDKDLDSIVSEDYLLIKGDDIKYDIKFYENDISDKELSFYKDRKDFYSNKNRLYSFNSIIHVVNLLFAEKESIIPKYDLILVDEFQDFNKLEWRLIELLNKMTRVVLVGDDDQSLYHDFRSAKPDLIRDLFDHKDSQKFTLDDCYRCTNIIVVAINSLIANARAKDYLKDNKVKKLEYPTKRKDNKNEVSKKYNQIDFLPSIPGDILIYYLEQRITKDIEDNKDEKVLVIVPSYLKRQIYDGLTKKGLNIVEYELFSDEKKKNMKHRDIINIFNTLAKRKTDNLVLRKILSFYLTDQEVKSIIIKSYKGGKKIWNCLEANTKGKIENDIEIFKKVKSGKDLLINNELTRLSELFNLKRLLSKMIKGFSSIRKSATEIEMTTIMSSKGLSADFVYYVGIDDREMLDLKTKKITDQKICEFLVGISRTEKKLTLISLHDENPKILDFIDKDCINKIKIEKN